MKKFTFLLFVLFYVSFIGTFNSLAQDSEISADPKFKKDQLPEKILKEKIKAKPHDGALVFSHAKDIVVENKLRKEFTIEIEEGGDYFLSAYANAVYDVPNETDPKMKEKKYPLQEISVYVDGISIGNLDIKKSGWASAKIKKDKKINLPTGQHTIIFESEMPNTPNVEVIKLSKSSEKAMFDNTEYDKYIGKLKANMDKNKNNNRKITQEEIDTEAEKELELKSASNSTTSWEVTPYTLDDGSGEGEGDFGHKMNVPIVYTYYSRVYLTSGTSVKYETFTNIPYTSTAVDPVMYLYNESNSSYAWSNDDGGPGYQSKIEVTIPSSGYYYLVVRAYSGSYASSSTGMQGVVDIYKNGSLYQDDAPVSGYGLSYYTDNKGTLNFFTAYSTGTPMIWISSTGSTGPLKWVGERYYYSPPMLYNWYDDARISLIKDNSNNMSIYSLVSSEYAWYVYWGNCDLYSGVTDYDDNLPSYTFPDLESGDAMLTAPATTTYNCGAWAGGLTSGWFWGTLREDNSVNSPIIGLTWYGDADPQNFDTWDDYFMNVMFPRYTGALHYSWSGANSTNGDIAMYKGNIPIRDAWGNIVGSYYGITHFSVRKEANNQTHGYDWESKPGQSARLFHPRDALDNDAIGAYGGITQYFREVPAPVILKSGVVASIDDGKIHSFEESVELGLTVEQEVYLTEEEEELLDNLQIKLKSSENTLEKLYNEWQEKCKSEEYRYNSNPYLFFENPECNKFAEYCIEDKEAALPFLINKTFEGEGKGLNSQLTAILFSGITGKTHGELMSDVKEEWLDNNYNEKGAFIAPSGFANSKNYMKKFLSIEYKTTSAVVTELEGWEDNHTNFNIYPNPMSVQCNVKINIPEDSKITIALYKDAQLIKYIKNRQSYQKGEHNIKIDRNSMSSGMYVCKLVINNKTYSRKILVL